MKRRIALISLLLSFFLLACGSKAEPEGTVPVMIRETLVSIEASDGLTLVGTFSAPPESANENVPGLLLLHMLNSERSAWDGLTEQLAAQGYASLAIDMRGHGETGGENDWQLAADDLQRAWRYLTERPEVDAERTVVIGASIGANMALITGANQPTINGVVLLSPGLIYRGVKTEEAMTQYGDRPALIVVTEGDKFSASSSRDLQELAQGEVQLEILPTSRHGTRMLLKEELGVDRLILSWLEELW
jgi:pimeloyl-ACP methyl ester carboxylesterase